MEKTIKDYKTQELKAIAFDLVVEQENINANLRAINIELAERAKEVKKEDKK
jgi:hypothetical protein